MENFTCCARAFNGKFLPEKSPLRRAFFASEKQARASAAIKHRPESRASAGSTEHPPGEALFTPLFSPPLCRSAMGAACRGAMPLCGKFLQVDQCGAFRIFDGDFDSTLGGVEELG
jgi:hypothetical protein